MLGTVWAFAYRHRETEKNLWETKTNLRETEIECIYNIIIYLFTAIGLSPVGSGYFTCKQNMKLVTTKFKTVGLHEKHVLVTRWSSMRLENMTVWLQLTWTARLGPADPLGLMPGRRLGVSTHLDSPATGQLKRYRPIDPGASVGFVFILCSAAACFLSGRHCVNIKTVVKTPFSFTEEIWPAAA